ncbi:hypothetical protein V2G26_016474 [Clonostachys chloroleuca]
MVLKANPFQYHCLGSITKLGRRARGVQRPETGIYPFDELSYHLWLRASPLQITTVGRDQRETRVAERQPQQLASTIERAGKKSPSRSDTHTVMQLFSDVH